MEEPLTRVASIDEDHEFAEAELREGGMRVVCAWHVRNFGRELVMREAAPGREGGSASHGVCADCLARMRR